MMRSGTSSTNGKSSLMPSDEEKASLAGSWKDSANYYASLEHDDDSLEGDNKKKDRSSSDREESSTFSCCRSALDIILSVIQSIPAITLLTALNVLLAVPFGSTYLSPLIPMDEAERESLGLRMSLLALSVGQFVMGTLGLSGIPSITPWQLGELSPFYHGFAQEAAKVSGGDESTILPTTLYLMSVSTVFVGLTFYGFGKLGLGKLTYFFPTYVMLGLIGGVGVWMMNLSITVSISPSVMPHGPPLLHAVTTGPFLLTLAFAAVLRVLNAILPKERYPLLDPIYFLSVPALFYLGLHLFGITVQEAIDHGYMFQDPDATEDSATGALGVLDSAMEVWSLFDVSKIHFQTIFHAAPSILSCSILSIFLVAPFIPAVAMFLKIEDFDMDREFVANGYSNLISSILSPGGLAVGHCYSSTVVYKNAGGEGKVSSFLVSCMSILAFCYAPQLVPHVPRCMAGALILDLGVNLFLEGILDPERKSDVVEYTSIWIIIIIMTTFNMTAALVAGLFTALFTFTLQSHLEQQPVRVARDATSLRSSRWRSTKAQAVLDDKRYGLAKIAIFQLQGHLFFGNMNKLQDAVLNYLEEKKRQQEEVSICILDFTLVVGIDSSAAQFLEKLKKRTEKQHDITMTVYVSGPTRICPATETNNGTLRVSSAATASRRGSLSHVEMSPADLFRLQQQGSLRTMASNRRLSMMIRGPFHEGVTMMGSPAIIDGRFFDTLDQALAECEDALIANVRPGLEKKRTDRIPTSRNFPAYETGDNETEKRAVMEILKRYSSKDDEQILSSIVKLCKRETYNKGETLWTVGDAGHAAKIVIEGSLWACDESKQDDGSTDPSDNSSTTSKNSFQQVVPTGSIVGLRSLILGSTHLTTVRCERDAIVYSLDRAGYEDLVDRHPRAAHVLDLSLARYLSHRLQHVSNRIYVSRSLPV